MFTDIELHPGRLRSLFLLSVRKAKMERQIFRIPSLILLTSVLVQFAAPAATAAEDSLEGRLIGLHCAEGGEVCPVDRLDPHIVLEEDFVVVVEDGSFYFLRDLPRDVKARYALDKVQASGKLVAANRYMRVDEFRVHDGKTFRTVWTEEAQEEAFRERVSRFDAASGYDVRTGPRKKR